jgi:flavin-dependent dehydrogenase
VRSIDAIVVGGGPAGSTAAWQLRRGGASVLVLDKACFPRAKLCAGWITPEVLQDLALTAGEYPHGMLTFERLHVALKGIGVAFPCVQHSIRRYEFDHWLLVRSGAPVERHTVRNIACDRGDFIIDGLWRCRYLVGAGGTSCPVYRTLFRGQQPRDQRLQAVALELELPYAWHGADCHLWFFERGLRGYSWCVPKADGWLNVGIGGMAQRLKDRGEDIREHWRHFVRRLEERMGIRIGAEPRAYSYYLRGAVEGAGIANAYLTGDAAGLATRDLCEGIGPAVRSGLRSAHSILSGAPYGIADIARGSLGSGLLGRVLGRVMTGGA